MGEGGLHGIWRFEPFSLFGVIHTFLLHDEMTTLLCRMVVVHTPFLCRFSFLEFVKSEIN